MSRIIRRTVTITLTETVSIVWAAELARRVNQDFVPMISKASGFIAYYVVDTGNDTVASVTVFQDQAGLEESNRMAADWVKENITSLFAGSPKITAGAVTVFKTAVVRSE